MHQCSQPKHLWLCEAFIGLDRDPDRIGTSPLRGESVRLWIEPTCCPDRARTRRSFQPSPNTGAPASMLCHSPGSGHCASP